MPIECRAKGDRVGRESTGFRCLISEKNLIEYVAANAGVTVSVWLRSLAIEAVDGKLDEKLDEQGSTVAQVSVTEQGASETA